MHKLGITDASFVYLDSPSSPMNVGSVRLLEIVVPLTDACAA